MRPTVVLFDVDGTLVNCGGAGRRAMEAAFVEVCGRSDVCAFPFGGGTDRAIARRGLVAAGLEPEERAIDDLLARYLRHLPAFLAAAEDYAVMPGVHAMLDRLEAHGGFAIGLGTGNVEPGARAKLRRGGIDGRFAFGGFGCDAEERSVLIEAGARRGAERLGVERDACRVVVIGDTPRDVEAARAIGAECIAVGTGWDDLATLREAGADLVVADLRAPEASRLLFEG